MRQLKRIRKGQGFNPDQINQLIDAVEELRKIQFAGGLESKWTATGLKVWSKARSGAASLVIEGQITSATPAGSNKWTYEFVEVEKTGTGYGGWGTKSGGVTGTAFNRVEVPNSNAGVQGNGVELSNLPPGFSIQPAAVGIVIVLTPVDVAGNTEYWFSYENAVDGDCTPGL